MLQRVVHVKALMSLPFVNESANMGEYHRTIWVEETFKITKSNRTFFSFILESYFGLIFRFVWRGYFFPSHNEHLSPALALTPRSSHCLMAQPVCVLCCGEFVLELSCKLYIFNCERTKGVFWHAVCTCINVRV